MPMKLVHTCARGSKALKLLLSSYSLSLLLLVVIDARESESLKLLANSRNESRGLLEMRCQTVRLSILQKSVAAGASCLAYKKSVITCTPHSFTNDYVTHTPCSFDMYKRLSLLVPVRVRGVHFTNEHHCPCVASVFLRIHAIIPKLINTRD